MCGPLRCEDRNFVSIVYTATPRARAPYTPALRQRMGVLCRAASVALTNMLRAGEKWTGQMPVLADRCR